jgi:hypothetical protein
MRSDAKGWSRFLGWIPGHRETENWMFFEPWRSEGASLNRKDFACVLRMLIPNRFWLFSGVSYIAGRSNFQNVYIVSANLKPLHSHNLRIQIFG